MAMINPVADDARTALMPAAALFRSLADPARLATIRHLAAGEARVVDLTGELGLAQSTVSAHLAGLRDCGLIDARPPGRASGSSCPHPALPALLPAAPAVLPATHTALCPLASHLPCPL